jgi:hypothetical protein
MATKTAVRSAASSNGSATARRAPGDHELQVWFVSSHLVDVPIVAPS